MDRTRPQTRGDVLSSEANKVIRLPAPARHSPELVRHRVQTVLAALVARDVVPRLLATYADPGSGSDQCPEPPPGILPVSAPDEIPPGADVLAFTELLLHGREGEPEAAVQCLLRAGQAAGEISLGLLTSAARHLGALWVADETSFTDVTQATFTLERIFHDLAGRLPAEQIDLGRSALLVATPGEQHSFGLSVLSAFFRAAGWSVQNPAVRSAPDVGRRIASSGFDLLGFSLGAEIHLTRLTRCITLARRASASGKLVVMVGGPIFVGRPDLVAHVGADATAPDAASALASARALLRERSA